MRNIPKPRPKDRPKDRQRAKPTTKPKARLTTRPRNKPMTRPRIRPKTGLITRLRVSPTTKPKARLTTRLKTKPKPRLKTRPKTMPRARLKTKSSVFFIFSLVNKNIRTTDQIGPIKTSHQREIPKGSSGVQLGVILIELIVGTLPAVKYQIVQNRAIRPAVNTDHRHIRLIFLCLPMFLFLCFHNGCILFQLSENHSLLSFCQCTYIYYIHISN